MTPVFSFLYSRLILIFLMLVPICSMGGNDLKENPNSSENSTFTRLSNEDLIIELPASVSKGGEEEIKIRFKDNSHPRLVERHGSFSFIIDGVPTDIGFVNGEATVKHIFNEPFISIYCEDFHFEQSVKFSHYWIYFIPLGFLALFVALRRLRSKK
jgi:hypothetical protein